MWNFKFFCSYFVCKTTFTHSLWLHSTSDMWYQITYVGLYYLTMCLPGHGKKEQLTLSRELPVQFAPSYIGSGSVHIRWRSLVPKPQTGHVGLHSDQLDHPPSTVHVLNKKHSRIRTRSSATAKSTARQSCTAYSWWLINHFYVIGEIPQYNGYYAVQGHS